MALLPPSPPPSPHGLEKAGEGGPGEAAEAEGGWLLVPRPQSRSSAVLTVAPCPPPQARELAWLLDSLHATLRTLKSSLEESYALLAPIDPGATLVVSTPRHETVKGTVTRVGTRLVKGAVAVRLRTQPPCLLTLDPARPVHLPELATLSALLTQSVDLLAFVLAESFGADGRSAKTADARFVSSQLRLLAEYLAEASALLRGNPPPSPPASATAAAPRPRTGSTASRASAADAPPPPSQHAALPPPPDLSWTYASVPPTCFNPPLAPGTLSVHLTIEDASLVLYLRALEPADAPVHFGTKLALAIGTARRLEHDEADRIFGYCPEGADELLEPTTTTATLPSGHGSVTARPLEPPQLHRTRSSEARHARGGGMGKGRGTETNVYVREKVRVDSADPSLLSLSAKLGALGHTLALARRNLAIVMADEGDDGAVAAAA